MRVRCLPLAAAALWGSLLPARADVAVLKKDGNWAALGGSARGGVPVCAVATWWPGNQPQALVLRWHRGADALTLVMHKANWRIPPGAVIHFDLAFGDLPPFHVTTINGSAVSSDLIMKLGRDHLPLFWRQFATGEPMRISFREGNEAPWQVAMAGSATAMLTMRQCMREGAVPSGAGPATPLAGQDTQPYAAQPSPDGSPLPLPLRPLPRAIGVPSSWSRI